MPRRPRQAAARWPRRSRRRMSQSALSEVWATSSDQRVALLARPWRRTTTRRGAPRRQSRYATVAPSRVVSERATSSSGLGQPLPERLHRAPRLDEPLADRDHDLLRAWAVAVDADGLDLDVDDLAGRSEEHT